MAIMLITHDLGVIAEMATDVAVMLPRARGRAGAGRRHLPRAQASLHAGPPHIQFRLRVRATREPLTPIRGSWVPHPYDRPTGCPFHPRGANSCPGTVPIREPPVLRPVADHHAVSCFLYE